MSTAQLPLGPTPDYVHDLLDTLIGRVPLDFHGHPVPEDVRDRVLRRMGRPAPADQPAAPLELATRELEVLRGMAEGLPNAEIGRQLYIAEDTVKTHARRLFRKLGVHDRAHAVAFGFRAGWLK
jgi:DNA-binding NarL/FixJ family response regulator